MTSTTIITEEKFENLLTLSKTAVDAICQKFNLTVYDNIVKPHNEQISYRFNPTEVIDKCQHFSILMHYNEKLLIDMPGIVDNNILPEIFNQFKQIAERLNVKEFSFIDCNEEVEKFAESVGMVKHPKQYMEHYKWYVLYI